MIKHIYKKDLKAVRLTEPQQELNRYNEWRQIEPFLYPEHHKTNGLTIEENFNKITLYTFEI
jgi:hypothetical protein